VAHARDAAGRGRSVRLGGHQAPQRPIEAERPPDPFNRPVGGGRGGWGGAEGGWGMGGNGRAEDHDAQRIATRCYIRAVVCNCCGTAAPPRNAATQAVRNAIHETVAQKGSL